MDNLATHQYKEQTKEIGFAIFCWGNGEKPPRDGWH